MKNIIFICHGSICRSPAAEYIAKSLSDEYSFSSRAVSYEEIGNDIYPPMKRALEKKGIPFSHHSAAHLSHQEAECADLIFYMDAENRYRLEQRFPEAVTKFRAVYCRTPSIREIEDPWYTGRYEKVVDELTQCIKDLLAARFEV